MSTLHAVPAEFAAKSRIRAEDYEKLYAESVRDPEGFWRRIGQRLDWIKPYTKVKDTSYDANYLHIRWFHDGAHRSLGTRKAPVRPVGQNLVAGVLRLW